MKVSLRILILTLLLTSTSLTAVVNAYSNVTVAQAKSMIDSNLVVILDVRTQAEYDSGHIRNAKLIPSTELPGRLNELNKNDSILVYCKSGGRSGPASQTLTDNGFLHVYNMVGGITAWIAAGYPVFVKYASIQSAINNADVNATILVGNGVYYEHLVINKTLTLLGEESSSAVIDGRGMGSQSIAVVSANNVAISGFTLRNSPSGGNSIQIEGYSNNTISGNIIESVNGDGLALINSPNNLLSGNIITNNKGGLNIDSSPLNMLRNNNLTDNSVYGFSISGLSSSDFVNDIDSSNTINGGPIYYWIGEQNKIVPYDASYVALINCDNITVQNLNLSNNKPCILLVDTTNSNLNQNNIADSAGEGILLFSSNLNCISKNKVESNLEYGIELEHQSSDNHIEENNITGNYAAGLCIQPGQNSHNSIWHNDLENTKNILWLDSGLNYWDDGYEGNHWSDYNGTDAFSGPFQNQTGADGIGDTPYVIDANNRDNYPLMSPFRQPETLLVPDDYSTIQEAINHANFGDTIFVRNGTYYENLNVNKSLTLVSDEATVDGGGLDTPVFNVTVPRVQVVNFIIKNAWAGVTLSNTTDCVIENNTIRDLVGDANTGILAGNDQYSYKCTILENTISNCNRGIHSINSENFTILENRVQDNVDFAIGLFDSKGCKISKNILSNNGIVGIQIASSQNNTITSNQFTNDNLEVWVESSSSTGNTIFHNDFSTSSNVTIDSPVTWDNGCEGNYWKDYNGTDTNSDGIGETPYTIDAKNVDIYPLMTLYWNPCDINHDLKVDMKDIGRAAKAFGTVAGNAYWNPHADITGALGDPDGKVDMRDIALTAKHFLEHYP